MDLGGQRAGGEPGLIVDLFAGGGGASTGLEAATGRPVDVAINHSPTALAVHAANHPRTRHLTADIWEVKPKEATGGRPVDILWASPDCRDFSVAKGGRPRSQEIRSLAWAVRRWARDVRPRLIFVENVPEFEGWGPLGEDGKRIPARVGETFGRWRRELQQLGYAVEHRVLNAAEYGAPTRRKRLFIVARRDSAPICWPAPTHGPGLEPFHAAAECIDWSRPCRSIFGRRRPLKPKTLWRIAQGLRRYILECEEPFIVPGPVAPFIVEVNQGTHLAEVRAFLTAYYGEDGTSGQHLGEPLRTITAKARLGLVTVASTDYVITDIALRMLYPPELLRAQFGRFAEDYDLSAATTLEAQTELIGNSVPPEVVEALALANIGPERARAAA